MPPVPQWGWGMLWPQSNRLNWNVVLNKHCKYRWRYAWLPIRRVGFKSLTLHKCIGGEVGTLLPAKLLWAGSIPVLCSNRFVSSVAECPTVYRITGVRFSYRPHFYSSMEEYKSSKLMIQVRVLIEVPLHSTEEVQDGSNVKVGGSNPSGVTTEKIELLLTLLLWM